MFKKLFFLIYLFQFYSFFSAEIKADDKRYNKIKIYFKTYEELIIFLEKYLKEKENKENNVCLLRKPYIDKTHRLFFVRYKISSLTESEIKAILATLGSNFKDGAIEYINKD